MTADLIKMFGGSLALTLLIELVIAFLLGLRSRKEIVLMLLVNVFTNPPAVLFYWLGRLYLPDIPGMAIQILIEFVVVVTEALIYHRFAKKGYRKIRHPVLLAIVTNICSWLTGRLM